ncbi:DUF6428 family protein [Jejudonia soesokkakensis]|uniref:DUF6428 family protein n=1 Tax=Jejudonia soesokkakensis TaxID=1323432 RepID=A0ABW2MSC9_9FLAO
MKTQEFLTLLTENKDKTLLFQFAPNQFVRPGYHITEVKNTMIESVDCGARSSSWNETVIQLLESPSEEGKGYMTSFKALGILKKVNSIRPFDPDSEVKFEYGNPYFHTAQLFVNEHKLLDDRLIFNLAVTATQCKAEDVCGIPSEKETMTAETCCTPGSSCC